MAGLSACKNQHYYWLLLVYTGSEILCSAVLTQACPTMIKHFLVFEGVLQESSDQMIYQCLESQAIRLAPSSSSTSPSLLSTKPSPSRSHQSQLPLTGGTPTRLHVRSLQRSAEDFCHSSTLHSHQNQPMRGVCKGEERRTQRVCVKGQFTHTHKHNL